MLQVDGIVRASGSGEGGAKGVKASLEQLAAAASTHSSNVDKLQAAESISEQMAQRQIIENEHTSLSMHQLTSMWEQLAESIARNVKLLEKELKMQVRAWHDVVWCG